MNKGSTIPVLMWVAGGALSLIATIALGFSTSTSQRVEIVNEAQAQTASTLRALCTDYGQTISRLDQNIQAIGSALKVNIVVGRPGADPCKQI